MKYLITGAEGQVGRELVNRLPPANVLAVNRNQLDITHFQAVNQIISHYQPDFIINAAAYTAVDKAESEPDWAYAVNSTGVSHLAQAAQSMGACLLHISTDYVFDGKGDTPHHEEDPVAPQNVYGQSKLDGERAAILCSRHIILRTAWVFGKYGHNFVKTMLRLGTMHKNLNVVADQYGAPTYAGDIANALICITQQIYQGKSNAFGVYHFSGYPYVSWYEFAQAIFQAAQQQGLLEQMPMVQAISTQAYPTPAKRPTNSRLALDKIQTTFGIAPSNWQHALQNLHPYASNT